MDAPDGLVRQMWSTNAMNSWKQVIAIPTLFLIAMVWAFFGEPKSVDRLGVLIAHWAFPEESY